MIFYYFEKPGCTKCEEEIKRIVPMLKEAGYKLIRYDVSTADGLAEAAMRGISECPVLIGENEEV